MQKFNPLIWKKCSVPICGPSQKKSWKGKSLPWFPFSSYNTAGNSNCIKNPYSEQESNFIKYLSSHFPSSLCIYFVHLSASLMLSVVVKDANVKCQTPQCSALYRYKINSSLITSSCICELLTPHACTCLRYEIFYALLH